MKNGIPTWVVAYKMTEGDSWMVKTGLAGPGHATDIVSQMLGKGFYKAVAVCGQLVVEVPDDEESKDKALGSPEAQAEELPKDTVEPAQKDKDMGDDK